MPFSSDLIIFVLNQRKVIKNHYNFKADIWSLGVNLYAILSEDLPFHGGEFTWDILQER